MLINVGVFFGGRSVEHEVSIISAIQAISEFDRKKYKVIPIYITKDGMMYTGDELLEIENYKDLNKVIAKCKKIVLGNHGDNTVIIKLPISRFSNNIIDHLDIAFPVIHGTNGEDGTLQGYFEALKLPYAGCDVLSSAVGMDKIFTKEILRYSGIPILDFEWFYSSDWLKDSETILLNLERKIGYPMIVKPSNIGSSVGITKVTNRDELLDAIDLARKFSLKILVEKMVVNLKEINCSVLGDYEIAEASVCEEPLSSSDILTYQDKYINSGSKGMGNAKRKLPAELPDETTEKIRELARKTFYTLGCAGVIRVDFLIDNNTNNIYVNEINSIPGSLSFYLWEASGIKYNKLIDRLIELSLKKSREKSQLIFSYETNLLSLNAKGIKGIKGIKS